jgi:HEAT repeat protein
MLIDDYVLENATSSDWCRRDLALDIILERAHELRKLDRKLARLICRALVLDTVDVIRMRALETLEELGYRRDCSLALRSLTDRAWVVRCSAVSAVGALGGPAHASSIIACFEDRSPFVRKYAYVAASDWCWTEAEVEASKALARERVPVARLGILYAFAARGSADSLAELAALARHPSMRVAESARSMVRELSGSSKLNP